MSKIFHKRGQISFKVREDYPYLSTKELLSYGTPKLYDFLLTYSNWMAPGLERREEDGQYQNQVMFSLSLIRQVSFCYPLPRLFVKWRHNPLNEEVRTEFGQIYEFDAFLASVNQNETMDKQSHRQNKKNLASCIVVSSDEIPFCLHSSTN